MKKILYLVLGISILCTSLNADGTPASGTGAEFNPYLISSLDNLLWLSTTPNIWDDNAYFFQTTDIDASDTENWNGGDGFSPIGNSNSHFNGSYNGNYYSITMLNIDRDIESVGFFGSLNGASITNLNLDATINSSEDNIGLLAGSCASSSIINCSATGVVSGRDGVGGLIGYCNASTVINRCWLDGIISGLDSVGGLIGECESSAITNSYTLGEVDGDIYVGGLVGRNLNNSGISRCYIANVVEPSGDFVGALVGMNNGSHIQECVWNSTLNSNLNDALFNVTGGTSSNIVSSTTDEMHLISTYLNLSWDFVDESTTGYNDDWGIFSGINSGFPFIYNNELLVDFTHSSNVDIYVGDNIQFTSETCGGVTSWAWDFDNDGLIDSNEESPSWSYSMNGYKTVALTVSNGTNTATEVKTDYIHVRHQFTGSGSEADPYQIATYNDLSWIRYYSLENNGAAGVFFLQTADIDASESQNESFIDEWDDQINGFEPIGTEDMPFYGNYNGDNYSIENIAIEDYAVFRKVSDASFLNLHIGVLDASEPWSETRYAAGIAYMSRNSRYSGISVSGSKASLYLGGIVGVSHNDIIQNCSSNQVLGTFGYPAQQDTLYGYAGGIVAYAEGSRISNCTVSGSIGGSNAVIGGIGGWTIDCVVEDNACASIITGGYGIVADAEESTFSRCTFTGEISSPISISALGPNLDVNTVDNCFYNFEQVLIDGQNQISMYALDDEMYNDWLNNNMDSSNLMIDDYLTFNGLSYEIGSIDDLNKLAFFGSHEVYCFGLTNDLDFSNNSNYSIPILKSDFNGFNHSFNNISLNLSGSVGFFREATDCTISNLIITNASVSGASNTGILCGSMSDVNCSNIDIINSTVVGNYSVGGLCGLCDSAISGSTINNIKVIDVDVSGTGRVGSVCGYIIGSRLSNSYANGSVLGNYYEDYLGHDYWNIYGGYQIGGLIGLSQNSLMNSSYFSGSVTGVNITGGVIGLADNSLLYSSYSNAQINGGKFVGGFVGKCINNTKISDCYSYSAIVAEGYGNTNYQNVNWLGGFVGNNDTSIIENSYCSNVMSWPADGGSSIGGFIGNNNNIISNCIWNEDRVDVTLGCGVNESASELGLYNFSTSEMQDITTYTNIGWDFVGETVNGTEDIWTINPELNNGYPYLVALEQSVGNEEETNATPELQTKLYNNYPNPFNPETTIAFSVKKNDVASLKIFNIRGQVVQSYPKFATGEHKVVWQGVDKNNKSVASGVYFYRLESKSGNQTKKMMLIK